MSIKLHYGYFLKLTIDLDPEDESDNRLLLHKNNLNGLNENHSHFLLERLSHRTTTIVYKFSLPTRTQVNDACTILIALFLFCFCYKYVV